MSMILLQICNIIKHMRKFSVRLKDLRQERGLSIIALSKETGISNASICRWENDLSDISSDNLIKLAKFFNVTIDYLVGLE